MTEVNILTCEDANLPADVDAFDKIAPVLTYIRLSKKIYDVKRLKDYRRMAVFILRSLAKGDQMKRHVEFFLADPIRRYIMTATPCVIEQATRAFFYHRSTFRERAALIKEHFILLKNTISKDGLLRIYAGEGISLWQQAFNDEKISLHLSFDSGQKKEGLFIMLPYVKTQNGEN